MNRGAEKNKKMKTQNNGNEMEEMEMKQYK